METHLCYGRGKENPSVDGKKGKPRTKETLERKGKKHHAHLEDLLRYGFSSHHFRHLIQIRF